MFYGSLSGAHCPIVPCSQQIPRAFCLFVLWTRTIEHAWFVVDSFLSVYTKVTKATPWFPCPFPRAFHHALPRVFAEYSLSISLVPRCFPAQMFVHLLGIPRVIRRFSKIPSLFVILGVPLLVPCVVLGALPYGVRPPYLPGGFFCSWGSLVSSLCVRGTFPYAVLPSPLTSLRVKPRPNNSNMWTQHIATLLDDLCCARLAALLRPVATCWLLLAQIWSSWANDTQHVTTGWPNAPTCCAETFCDRLAGPLEVRSLTRCVLHAFRMYLCVSRVPCMVSVPIRRVFPVPETDIYSYNKIFIVYKFTSYIKT